MSADPGDVFTRDAFASHIGQQIPFTIGCATTIAKLVEAEASDDERSAILTFEGSLPTPAEGMYEGPDQWSIGWVPAQPAEREPQP
ncbi:hypothetical protein [Nonomuraea dietziae]|uniref:hypothetical protein n=1 Tax=Nonomuraea dietziae TaxID=65515 RepID=UPI0033C56187